MTAPSLREVISALETPTRRPLAEVVGLGRTGVRRPRRRRSSKVLFAVDATAEVVDEALEWGAQLLVAHHPLLLRGVDTSARTPQGALCAPADPGRVARCSPRTPTPIRPTPVSPMPWPRALGLTGHCGPLRAETRPAAGQDGSVFGPAGDRADRVRQALFDAGAGEDRGLQRTAAGATSGTGQFRPVDGAPPGASGTSASWSASPRTALEVVAPRRAAVGRARRAAGGAPLRGTRLRRDRAGRRCPAARGSAGSASCREPMTLARVHRSACAPACRPRRGVSAPPATRTRPCGRSRCAAAPATRCSVPPRRRRRRRLRHRRPAAPPGRRAPACAAVRRWSTSRTGPASTRGARRPAVCSTRHSGVRDAGGAVSHGAHRPVDDRRPLTARRGTVAADRSAAAPSSAPIETSPNSSGTVA